MKTAKFKDRQMVIDLTVYHIEDYLRSNPSNFVIELDSIIDANLKLYCKDTEWMTKRQFEGLKKEVMQNLHSINQRNKISLKLGTIKEYQELDFNRVKNQ